MPGQANNAGSVSKGSKQATPEQLWIAIAHCYRAMSSLIERSFQDSGLSLTDFMLLEGLLHKGSMTITEIQASALLATGSMTAAVDRLESRQERAGQRPERHQLHYLTRLTANPAEEEPSAWTA